MDGIGGKENEYGSAEPPTSGHRNTRVGVVHWDAGLDLHSAVIDTLVEVGCEVKSFAYDAKLPEDLDVVVARGPVGTLWPLGKQLLSMPSPRHPALALWMAEPLPNPAVPKWIGYSASLVRSWVERLAFRQSANGAWESSPHLQWITRMGWRLRSYGELHWLHRAGVISVLAVSSRWNAEFLRARGFDPMVAYLGFRPDWAANLEIARDVPVLWLGVIGSKRRQQILCRVRDDLRRHGIEVLVIDGVENPYKFGHERVALLNRTQIVLNLLRSEWDNNAMRFYLAAANRCLIVTEPTLPHTSFTPGVHLVESPVEQMAETIRHYLASPAERQPIVERAYQLVTAEYTMRQSVSQILERALATRK